MLKRRGTAAGTGPGTGHPAGTPAFRAEPTVAPTGQPSRRQTAAMLSALVLVTAAIGTASYVVRPDTARSFDLVHGSVFLTDQLAPVGIDLASGRPTLRLVGADKQVGATRPTDLALLPVHGGTMMVDRLTGQFNMVDDTGFVIKHDGGGVLLPRRTDDTTSTAVAAMGGPETGVAGAAYIVRSGPRGTNVLLVNESNVEEASRGIKIVRPRANLTTTAVAEPGSDSVVGANGDLWALFGTGDTHEIRQMTVPARSGTGALLTNRLRGTVSGPAAIGAASAHDDGSGDTAIAVASANRITYFPADGSGQHVISLAAVPGLDSVVPVSAAKSRIAFLMHGAGGWSMVSVGADGSGLRGPTRIAGLPASAQPARPSWSSGALYTIDRTSGAIYRIDADSTARTVPGAATYPVATKNGRVAETADFSDAYVVARGSRVIINSPSHTQAVALFTDGRRRPLIIHKSSAVDVSVAGGAEALTRRDLDPSDERGNTRSGSRSKPTAGTQINNQVDCANTTQMPHIPQLGVPTPGSRSIGLTWTYPTLDPQDCIPSSYLLTAKAVSASAPSAGGSVEVHGQTSANLTGLYPNTEYRITVAAYISGQGTSSRAIEVTTGPEGPAAPTNVTASPDSSGNWVVNWTGCGSAAQGCVGVDSWRIVPSICDGLGLSATPAPLDVTADSSTRVQAPATYRGGAGLLGRGLSFQVIGTGTQGQVGTPSATTGCTYSWRAPDAGAISVQASTPAQVSSADGETTVTATVAFANSQTVDLGGVDGTLTYQLLSGGTVINTVGPTTDASVQLSGVRAGQDYSVRVTASPPRHPDVVVPVGMADVAAAVADWPALGVNASFSNDTATTGTLTLSFDLNGAAARRQTYDLVDNASTLTCGSTGRSLATGNRSIGESITYSGISRFDMNGNCAVRIQLQQNPDHSTSPPLFGAALSGAASADISLPAPTSTATSSDFAAQWGSDPDNPQVVVTYSGSDPLAQTSDWTIRLTNGTTADCGTATDQPTATLTVSDDCIKQGGSFSVSIDYKYYNDRPSFTRDVQGTAPQPIQVSEDDFTVAWGGDATSPTVDITYHGEESDTRLAEADWTETVTSSTVPDTCGSATKAPGSQPVSVPVDLTICPPGDQNGGHSDYTVKIHYDDVYGTSDDFSYTVDGDPPS